MMRALLLLALVGCGSVELAPDVTVDAGKQEESDGPRRGDASAAAELGPEAPPTCSPPSCDACTQATSAGPGYPTAEVCRQVVACVLSGDGGVYPWQSCHNLAAGGADWGGLACAQRVGAGCP